jgi:branched-chain amino acid transport system ATP-binding protein
MNKLLEVSDISKHFGGVTAIHNLSFSLEKGEILGVIGPNGSGKTTLINLISGIYEPNQGRILYQGQNVTGLKPNRLVRLGLARTFQATILYSEATVLENALRGTHLTMECGLIHFLLHSQNARRREKEAIEKAMEYLEFVGLGKVLDQQVKNLPYGYQKFLGVVVALATGPDLLMLDEPAAGLNMEEALEIKRAIEKINERGISLILVDHNMRFMMSLCHRMVVLNYGEKIAEGPPQTIKKDEKVIKAYLGGGQSGGHH